MSVQSRVYNINIRETRSTVEQFRTLGLLVSE